MTLDNCTTTPPPKVPPEPRVCRRPAEPPEDLPSQGRTPCKGWPWNSAETHGWVAPIKAGRDRQRILPRVAANAKKRKRGKNYNELPKKSHSHGYQGKRELVYNVIKNNERKKEEFEINYQNISIWVFPDEDILTECAIKEIRDALKSPDDYDYWFEPYDCFDPDGWGKPD